MTRYIFRSALQSVVVVILVTIVVFAIMRGLPGDPVTALTGESDSGYTAEQMDQIRESLGLNRPFAVQYLDWASDAVRGDFGKSARNHLPVSDEIETRLVTSIQLAFVSLIIGVILGILFGIVAALRQGSVIDMAVTLIAMSGIAVPVFVSAMLLILIFNVRLHWLPVGGFTNLWDDPVKAMKSMILPAGVLGLSIAAPIMRHTRSSLLEVLRLDYVRTARAKGLPNRAVVLNHALRNSLLPVVTVIGLRMAVLLEGAVITESMFSIPGIGRLAVTAISTRDYPMLQGVVVVFAIITVVVNLLVDILYAQLDPTIKYA
ncbi:MAG: ABC transporter permease [Dehalococcoidia bacterium]|nr:ABC transporter permease [Dehalococcoidia bacterium]